MERTNLKTVLFLGSKPIGYQCLEYLIREGDAMGIRIAGVLSNDNLRFDKAQSVRRLAAEADLRFIEDLEQVVSEPPVDFLLSVQYHQILKPRHIAQARRLAINLHMAPLPEYRGCNQFSFAIFDGAKVFGTTLHRLEEGIDSGDILAERRFPLPEGCFVQDLYAMTHEASVVLFKESIGDIFAGRYTLTPQASLVEARGTSLHYRSEISRLKTIDLTHDPQKILRQIRATAMPGFEPPYAVVEGRKIYMIPEQHHRSDEH
jgi:methionyl-tRNA formyltransferase